MAKLNTQCTASLEGSVCFQHQCHDVEGTITIGHGWKDCDLELCVELSEAHVRMGSIITIHITRAPRNASDILGDFVEWVLF